MRRAARARGADARSADPGHAGDGGAPGVPAWTTQPARPARPRSARPTERRLPLRVATAGAPASCVCAPVPGAWSLPASRCLPRGRRRPSGRPGRPGRHTSMNIGSGGGGVAAAAAASLSSSAGREPASEGLAATLRASQAAVRRFADLLGWSRSRRSALGHPPARGGRPHDIGCGGGIGHCLAACGVRRTFRGFRHRGGLFTPMRRARRPSAGRPRSGDRGSRLGRLRPPLHAIAERPQDRGEILARGAGQRRHGVDHREAAAGDRAGRLHARAPSRQASAGRIRSARRSRMSTRTARSPQTR